MPCPKQQAVILPAMPVSSSSMISLCSNARCLYSPGRSPSTLLMSIYVFQKHALLRQRGQYAIPAVSLICSSLHLCVHHNRNDSSSIVIAMSEKFLRLLLLLSASYERYFPEGQLNPVKEADFRLSRGHISASAGGCGNPCKLFGTLPQIIYYFVNSMNSCAISFISQTPLINNRIVVDINGHDLTVIILSTHTLQVPAVLI